MCDVLDKVESRGIEKGIAKGVAKGKAEGEIEGKNQMALLVKKLLNQGRMDDVKRASEDEVYRDQLIKEFGIR
jgi:flagellar biosynthesis/type III secretory pathway protein FliH